MTHGGGWVRAVVSASALVAARGAADAAILYLGLPGGTSSAYVTLGANAGWTRLAAADLPRVGFGAAPALADLDGDGDADALVGDSTGHVVAFENDGTDAVPVWTRHAAWDLGVDVGGGAAPALADLDGDGDADLVVGSTAGTVAVYENAGGRAAPSWRARPELALGGLGGATRPTLGDVDGDRHADLVVGLGTGAVAAWAGPAPFTRRPEWDAPAAGSDRAGAALGDLDGDGRPDLVVSDGLARMTVYRNAGGAWQAMPGAAPPDPGSGPLAVAFVPLGGGTSSPPPSTSGAPVARLRATPTSGAAPLTVRLDASGSSDPNGDALAFAWDFGDGSAAAVPPADPGRALQQTFAGYATAKATRDAKNFAEAVTLYLADAAALLPLTTVAGGGPITVQGTNDIGRLANWQLGKIGHDLGAIYLFHSLGLSACDRYARALQYSWESAKYYTAGGFGSLVAVNGTGDNIAAAEAALARYGCAVPTPTPMFAASTPGGAVVDHRYAAPGVYTATVTARDGTHAATASVVVRVGTVSTPPPSPPAGGSGDAEPYEGFGASTPGGAGGREIAVTEATDAAVRAAFEQANAGHAVVVFRVTQPIAVKSPLPQLTGSFITIEGNGATLLGDALYRAAPIVDVRGHDVIVRNLRLRNGGDNIRAQGPNAYNVVFSHLSSTGSGDDGISIGYGAHDVTVQYCFLAGNTRSIFLKYKTTTNVSIHHTWIMKQWIRGPLVSTNVLADLRNLIVEDWTLWGTRFEDTASGNVVASLWRDGDFAASNGNGGSALRFTGGSRVYASGNVFAGHARSDAVANVAAPFPAPLVTTLPVPQMIGVVEGRAGCMPRDAVDQAYIAMPAPWPRATGFHPIRLSP